MVEVTLYRTINTRTHRPEGVFCFSGILVRDRFREGLDVCLDAQPVWRKLLPKVFDKKPTRIFFSAQDINQTLAIEFPNTLAKDYVIKELGITLAPEKIDLAKISGYADYIMHSTATMKFSSPLANKYCELIGNMRTVHTRYVPWLVCTILQLHSQDAELCSLRKQLEKMTQAYFQQSGQSALADLSQLMKSAGEIPDNSRFEYIHAWVEQATFQEQTSFPGYLIGQYYTETDNPILCVTDKRLYSGKKESLKLNYMPTPSQVSHQSMPTQTHEQPQVSHQSMPTQPQAPLSQVISAPWGNGQQNPIPSAPPLQPQVQYGHQSQAQYSGQSMSHQPQMQAQYSRQPMPQQSQAQAHYNSQPVPQQLPQMQYSSQPMPQSQAQAQYNSQLMSQQIQAQYNSQPMSQQPPQYSNPAPQWSNWQQNSQPAPWNPIRNDNSSSKGFKPY